MSILCHNMPYESYELTSSSMKLVWLSGLSCHIRSCITISLILKAQNWIRMHLRRWAGSFHTDLMFNMPISYACSFLCVYLCCYSFCLSQVKNFCASSTLLRMSQSLSTAYPLRLVSQTGFSGNLSAGSLEVLINNEWGTICIQGFQYQEAAVSCRQLGLSNSPGAYGRAGSLR